MTKTKISLSWKITAILTAVIIFTLSVCSYAANITADTTSSTRTYWRHDYSSSDLSSYYEYSLTINSEETVSLSNTRTVFLPNDMVRDYDTSVVRLSTGGTGFIIGEHTIVTAAHCIFNKTTREFKNFSISIIDSTNSESNPIQPKYVHIPKNYSETDFGFYDYALIYVEQDLSDFGMFYLGIPLDSYISNQGTVTVSGFPQEYPDGYDFDSLGWGTRFKATGNIVPTNDYPEYMMWYTADTSGGDSGGPVYIEETLQFNDVSTSYKTIVAINSSGGDFLNCGVKIVPDLLKFYYGNTYETV